MAAYHRFDFNKRIILQTRISQGVSFARAAEELEMAASSVSREVRQYRTLVDTFGIGSANRCIHRFDCENTGICPGQQNICRNKKCAEYTDMAKPGFR